MRDPLIIEKAGIHAREADNGYFLVVSDADWQSALKSLSRRDLKAAIGELTILAAKRGMYLELPPHRKDRLD